ncbi:hypothetical protein AVEN_42685-1 [Araneus ventricosus]|uniref:Uncharacterized protein n=1 Tax=Araneus ventricosus TaxID=182803 RepID=A0A4Y2BMF1_ARAVE|nr:hypothetical protein AVEN_42685-1 [Araneus ventricosus]
MSLENPAFPSWIKPLFPYKLAGEIAISTQLHERPNVLPDYILITSPLMAGVRMELGKSCLRREFVPIAFNNHRNRLHRVFALERNRCSKFPEWSVITLKGFGDSRVVLSSISLSGKFELRLPLKEGFEEA